MEGRILFAVLASVASFRVGQRRADLSDTCDSQWNNRACAGSECHTCGDRITYLKGTGLSDTAAKQQVAGEFPTECGACGGGGGGPCESWCEADYNGGNNQGRHCAPGDMAYLCGGCSFCGGAPSPSPTPPTPGPAPGPPGSSIKVMSYNTEYTGYSDGRWYNFARKIREVAPAIVGLQECQNRDGLAREAGYTPLYETGNQNYILFDPSKVSHAGGGYMRIPRDNYARRYITWGQFMLGNRTIYHFNTHLPHNHGEASDRRTHGWIADSLLQKRRELGIENEPAIMTGDMNSHASGFNTAPNGGFESTLVANGFVWAYEVRGNPGYGRIDSILYSGAHWTHSGCADTGTGSSDHSSIACTLTLK